MILARVVFREHPHIQRNVREAIVTADFHAELGLNLNSLESKRERVCF
jgi:hypothetical protein